MVLHQGSRVEAWRRSRSLGGDAGARRMCRHGATAYFVSRSPLIRVVILRPHASHGARDSARCTVELRRLRLNRGRDAVARLEGHQVPPLR